MTSQKVTLEKNGGNRFLEQIYILFSDKFKLDILDSKMKIVQGIKAFLIRLIQLFIASWFRIYDYLNPIFVVVLTTTSMSIFEIDKETINLYGLYPDAPSLCTLLIKQIKCLFI